MTLGVGDHSKTQALQRCVCFRQPHRALPLPVLLTNSLAPSVPTPTLLLSQLLGSKTGRSVHLLCSLALAQPRQCVIVPLTTYGHSAPADLAIPLAAICRGGQSFRAHRHSLQAHAYELMLLKPKVLPARTTHGELSSCMNLQELKIRVQFFHGEGRIHESRWHIVFFRGCLAWVPGQHLTFNRISNEGSLPVRCLLYEHP